MLPDSDKNLLAASVSGPIDQTMFVASDADELKHMTDEFVNFVCEGRTSLTNESQYHNLICRKHCYVLLCFHSLSLKIILLSQCTIRTHNF